MSSIDIEALINNLRDMECGTTLTENIDIVEALEQQQKENEELKKVIKLAHDWVEMDLDCNIRDAIAHIPKKAYINLQHSSNILKKRLKEVRK